MENINVKELVSFAASKLQGDDSLLSRFKKSPIETITALLAARDDGDDKDKGILQQLLDKTDIDDKLIAAVVNGVKAKLGMSEDGAGGLLGKVIDLLDGDK